MACSRMLSELRFDPRFFPTIFEIARTLVHLDLAAGVIVNANQRNKGDNPENVRSKVPGFFQLRLALQSSLLKSACRVYNFYAGLRYAR